MKRRKVLYWAAGALCILAGSVIASNVNFGELNFNSVLALFLSLLLVMLGGLLWIGISASAKSRLK